MPSSVRAAGDGCKGDTVPMAVGRWYELHEFGCHLGNVGLIMAIGRKLTYTAVYLVHHGFV